MKDNNELKNIVKEKYGEIAFQHNNSCGCGCSKTVEYYSVIQDEYKGIKGHVQDICKATTSGLLCPILFMPSYR